MALLTLVELPDDFDVWGKHNRMVYTATGDNDYPTGGYPITDNDVGGGNIRSVRVIGCNAAAAALVAAWDYVNSKLLVMYPTGGASAPAALADPVPKTPILAHDTSNAVAVTAAADDQPSHAAAAGTLAAGRAKELADNTDLTSCVWKLEFITL